MTERKMNERKRALGYTSEQIAQLSGVPLGTVQKIFSGQTRSPRYDTLKKLERVLCPESTGGVLRDIGAAYRPRQEEKVAGHCTLEDFYALPEGTRAELLNGEIFILEAPTTAHQVIALQIGYMLESYIDANGGSCVPFLSPVDVRFSDDAQEVLEPDVVLVCDRDKIHKKEIQGAPDFVVEILSPSNTAKRMLIKKNRYLNNGVREYWEIDPEEKIITVMLLDPQIVAERLSLKKEEVLNGKFGPQLYLTQQYDFSDRVPVAVWDGKCKIDFPKISRRLEAISS